MLKLADIYRAVTDTVPDPFPTEPRGLPADAPSEVVDLRHGDTFHLEASAVAKPLGSANLRMLAYNGSIPGPTLRVPQGAEVTVHFANHAGIETTVHWHGLRLDNRFDGVPDTHHGGMQPPVAPGETFTYRLRFPDPGIYWYHPHLREDYAQELGLYGNIIVTPADPSYWAPANREVALILDDILLKRGKVAPFGKTESNRTAMGRYGDVMLVNGRADYSLDLRQGEIVRFYLTNTANVRPFNLRIPGARMKLVGSDGGRIEREQFVEEILVAPSERAVVDVLFERPGDVRLEHRGPDKGYTLGTIAVSQNPVELSYAREFSTLRADPELAAVRNRLVPDLERSPDKSLALIAEMPGMKKGAHGGHGGHGHAPEEIEWEDNMVLHNRMTNPRNMFWKLVDAETGRINHEIDWSFNLGRRIKLRILNDPHSDHPMQHPFHLHGQRFLVLSRDGEPNDTLAWKDTVLIRTGETVDLLIPMENPGTWMGHCHIAEHLEGGMMLSYEVRA